MAMDSVRAHEAYNMIEVEAKHVEENYRYVRYSEAIKVACDRVIEWWKQADEFVIKDLATFIATHRQACAWAVLAARNIQIKEK